MTEALRRLSAVSLAVVAFLWLAHAPDAAERVVIERNGWRDLDKNGQRDPYEDPNLDIEVRLDDLIARMTVEEKTVQLATLYGYKRSPGFEDAQPTPEWKKRLWKDGIANIDEHCNGVKGLCEEFARPPSRHARLMNDVQRFFIEETRLGVPVDFTNEGIRGLCHWGATSFPAASALGASWDRALVQEIAQVVGREARALGYTNVYAPVLDLARDPRWGRVVESFGEDPYLVSQLGLETVRGLQSQDVTSTLKHYAVYSVPKGGRDGDSRTDPHESPREVETIFLAPFKAAITKGGALGVMASYNDYDAVPIAANHEFLTDRLRGKFGFHGYVVSDSDAVKMLWSKHRVARDYKEAVRKSINAGLNVRTEFNAPDNFVRPLRELVESGEIAKETLDSRVRDVLRVKMRRGLFDRPYLDNPDDADRVVRAPEHLALSKRAALESMVLLKNDGGRLPLARDLRTLFVTGPNADSTSFADNRYGPYRPETISVLEGIKRVVSPHTKVVHALGCAFTDPRWPESEILPEPADKDERAHLEEAVALARQADVAVVVLGESEAMVGESRSRTSLDLPPRQLELAQAIHATGTPTVVVLLAGRALSINWIAKHVPAILLTSFPGEFGGLAVAETLFGDYNPGGKLAVTVPRTVGQIPWNFPTRPKAQAAPTREFPPTMVHGSLFPFGFGLSYTTFRYENIRINPKRQDPDGTVRVSVDVVNTGTRDGDEVVQVYVTDLLSSVVTYEKVLRNFERVSLRAGERRTVSFDLHREDFELLDLQMEWLVEDGMFRVQVAGSSEDAGLSGEFEIRQ